MLDGRYVVAIWTLTSWWIGRMTVADRLLTACQSPDAGEIRRGVFPPRSPLRGGLLSERDGHVDQTAQRTSWKTATASDANLAAGRIRSRRR